MKVQVGRLIYEEEKRDAIHVAIVPAMATVTLRAGQPVGLIDPEIMSAGPNAEHIGVVDPFLRGAYGKNGDEVREGNKFWLFLYPDTVTQLRHDWIHPAIDHARSKKWIEEWALTCKGSSYSYDEYHEYPPLSYEEVMNAARDYLDNDDYLYEGGRWDGYSVPDEFWDHFEVVTGNRVASDKRGSFFSCSC